MPIPIAVAIRRQIVERHQAGVSLAQLAREFEMPYESVRNVWRLYRKEGRIEPDYSHCGREIQASARVYRAAIYLKRSHPSWGASLIRQVILEKWRDESLPTARNLQRWFEKAKVNQPRKRRLAELSMSRASRVHQVWELDSREGIRLLNGEKVVWLIVSDEASGAILEGQVFSPSQSFATEC